MASPLLFARIKQDEKVELVRLANERGIELSHAVRAGTRAFFGLPESEAEYKVGRPPKDKEPA